MLIKDVVYEDFINYKKPSMFLIFPFCDFKCDRENGCQYCQNMPLIHSPNINLSTQDITNKYINNPITSAIVCGGLEPLDSWYDLLELLTLIRQYTDDDFVIYTGYNKEEISDKISILSRFSNVIIKFGRFKPDQKSHYDEILGVELASNNQYAERIS